MKITNLSNFNNLQTNQNKKIPNKNNLSFFRASKCRIIRNELSEMGISSDFNGNGFLAECVRKTVKLFDNLFGRSALPSEVTFEPLYANVHATFWPYSRKIAFNSQDPSFTSMDKLIETAQKGYHCILPNDFSSLHPAGTFVHEFSHAAHHYNLKTRHYEPSLRMDELRHTQVPTVIGRLITRFKLGNYALDKNGGMNEFMAERITQDICNGITEEMWTPNKKIDVGYADIFNRKWNYRYSSPQSYLDYFTQQIWNGNLSEAENVAGEIERYLQELDAVKVPASVAVASQKVKQATRESIFETIGETVGCVLTGLAESFTNLLDGRNRLRIKQ